MKSPLSPGQSVCRSACGVAIVFSDAFHKLFIPVVCGGLTSLILTGCGSIIESTRTEGELSGPEPITMGDVVVYYLPKGLIKVDGVFDEKKGWIIIVSTEVRPDRNQRYDLSLNNRYPFYDHNATLVVNEKGLLKTVAGSATDHTVDAAVSLISAAGSALTFGASFGSSGLRSEDEPIPPPFHVVLDPFNGPTSVTLTEFKINVDNPPALRTVTPSQKQTSKGGRLAGVMTRLLVPFTVTVEPTENPARQTQSVGILLPDPRQDYLLTVPRAPLVTNETTLQFADGCLVSRDIKRPSVVYGVLSIPKNILSALVPIPGSIRAEQVSKIEATKTILTDEAEIKKLRESP